MFDISMSGIKTARTITATAPPITMIIKGSRREVMLSIRQFSKPE
jgi:hypothetical protein